MKLPDGLLMRTPAYHSLESPLHYVLRLAEANGYQTPGVVVQIATCAEEWHVLANWDFMHLNKVLPSCRHLPATCTYRWPGSDRRCDLSLLHKRILSRHLNAPSAGICPECVHELGFAPAWWDLKYAIACPKHRVMFVSACPRCAKPLSHTRRGLLTCACGASLDVPPSKAPTDELLWLMQLLQSKAEARPGLSSGRGSKRRPMNPDEVDLNTLCRIIETVLRAELKIARTGTSSPSLEDLHRFLPNVASFLYGWPNGVRAFCSRWQAYVRATKVKRLSFRSEFSWAFESLFKNLGRQRREALFVPDAVLCNEIACRGGCAVDVRADDLREIARNDGPYCSLARASVLSGIPLHTLVRLARKGALPTRVKYLGERHRYEIQTEVARTVKLDYHPSLQHREASKYLGVTHGLFRDLRRCGALKKVRTTMIPSAIAICDLAEFKQKAFEAAIEPGNASNLVSLDALRQSRYPRDVIVRLVTGALDRSIPCYRAQPPSSRLDALLVRRSDAAQAVLECVHRGD